jgi:hypothetical protein
MMEHSNTLINLWKAALDTLRTLYHSRFWNLKDVYRRFSHLLPVDVHILEWSVSQVSTPGEH